MLYTTIAKDFLSFKAITENLYELKKLIWQNALDKEKDKDDKNNLSYKIYSKGKTIYREIINYYFFNFARIF